MRWRSNLKLVYLGLAAGLLFSGHVVSAEVVAKAGGVAKTRQVGHDLKLPEPKEELLALNALGVSKPIMLVGDDALSTVDFSFKTLDIVNRLKLHLKYDYSAKLDGANSRLDVLVNGKQMASFPLSPEHAQGMEVDIPLDSSVLSEWNHLTFKVASHFAEGCDDPRAAKKWVRIYHRFSYLEASVIPLPLLNDLSLFPMPFFDRHDLTPVQAPFVFVEKPGLPALKAAGIMASWFGNLASWRGTGFSVSRGALPEGDAIVLATEGSQIGGWQVPRVEEGYAQVSIIEHPNNPANARLVLIVGRSEEDLVDAVTAITLGKVRLEGAKVTFSERSRVEARPELDAPNWLTTNHRVFLKDLLTPEEIVHKGVFVDPLNMILRLPFNMYSAEGRSLPVTLKLKASNGKRRLAQIEGKLNGVSFQTFQVKRVEGSELIEVQADFSVPANKMTGKDALSFSFLFQEEGTPECSSANIKYDEVRIDPNSYIDVSELPKFVAMPNLSYFAYTGYPFTRHAGLSETLVLVPDQFGDDEIASYLTILGHMGEKTGWPALQVELADFSHAEKSIDRDILVVGTAAHLQPLMARWGMRMPVNPEHNWQPFPWPVHPSGSWQWLVADDEGYTDRLNNWYALSMDLSRRLRYPAMLTEFESPLGKKRAAVVLIARDTVALRGAAQMIASYDLAHKIQGDVSLLEVDDYSIDSYRVTSAFSLGAMSYEERLKRMFWHNPWVSFVLIFLLALLLPEVLFNRLKDQANKRLE